MKTEPEREEAAEATEGEVSEEVVPLELRGWREKGGLREVWREGALPALLSVRAREETWERYQFSR